MAMVAHADDSSTWCDAHLHAWDSARLQPPWLVHAPQWLGRFDGLRYVREGGVGGGVVLVEADAAPNDRVAEAASLAEFGRELGRPFSIVAGVEPASDEFEVTLERVAAGTVTGARRVLHGGEIACNTERFQRDLVALGARRISFDFCVRWTDLWFVEQCARSTPTTTLVLDHLGNPPLALGWSSPERLQWQRLVAAVAACENVSVKWSGMFENAGRALSAHEARPWFEWCLTCFGVTRVLWGSNWPVCFANARLTQWIAVSAEIARERSVDEQAAILGGNARRLYRL